MNRTTRQISSKKSMKVNESKYLKNGLKYIKESNDKKGKAMLRAKTEFEKVLKINPNNIIALSEMGLIITEIDSFNKSLKYYNKAKELEPNNYEIYFSIANSALGESKSMIAEKYSLKSLRLFHANKEKNLIMLVLIYDVLINSYIHQKKYKKAREIAKKGLSETKDADWDLNWNENIEEYESGNILWR